MGGAETQSFILAKYLKQNFDARIVFIADNNEGPVKSLYEEYGFETYSFFYRLKGSFFQKLIDTLRFVKFLRSFQPDFILPYTSDNCKKMLPGWKYTGAKYAWWNMQDEGRFLYKTKHEEGLLNGVTEIVSNSNIGTEFLETNFKLSNKIIVKYNNPITVPDADAIQPVWRAKLSLNDNDIVISMIANLTSWKDHTTLIKAWKVVFDYYKNKNRPCYLLLAGAEKDTTDTIKVLAFDSNIAESIKILGSIKETDALILESDLVVHSSNKEGVPNAICEAMALANVVVATDISGNREALTDKYENYTLSKALDPQHLAEKIIYLLENKKLKEEIGHYNKKRIEENYTEDKMINIFLDSFLKHI